MTRPLWIFLADDLGTLVFIAVWVAVAVLAVVQGNWGNVPVALLTIWLLLSLRWEQKHRPDAQG